MNGNARLESIWGGADAEVQLRTLKTRGSIFIHFCPEKSKIARQDCPPELCPGSGHQ